MFGTFHARVTRELFKGWSSYVKSSVASTRKVLFFDGGMAMGERDTRSI